MVHSSVLTALDKKSVSWFHFQAIIIAGEPLDQRLWRGIGGKGSQRSHIWAVLSVKRLGPPIFFKV